MPGLQRYDTESQDTDTVYKDMSAKICPVMQRYESQDIPGLQRYESQDMPSHAKIW